jgi:hypothetical protein
MDEMNEQHEEVDLSHLDEEYAQVKEPERGSEVPDGKYVAGVERVELTKAKKEPHQPMLKWQLQILEGKHKGRKLFRNNMLATRENLAWLKGDLKACGVEITKVSELKANLDRLLDCVLQVTVRTKQDSQGRDQTNVFIDKRLVDYQQPAEGGDGAGGDAPF